MIKLFLVFAAVLGLGTAARIDDEDDSASGGYDFPITPYTQTAVRISPDGKGGFEAEPIKVPEEPNKFATLCFEATGKTLIQCFYLNRGSSKVDIVSVLPEKTKL